MLPSFIVSSTYLEYMDIDFGFYWQYSIPYAFNLTLADVKYDSKVGAHIFETIYMIYIIFVFKMRLGGGECKEYLFLPNDSFCVHLFCFPQI